MSYPKRASFDNLRSIVAADIKSNYEVVGSAFEGPVRMIKIVNITDAPVLFSTDGTNDKDIIPTNSSSVYDISANRTNQENFLLAKGEFAYIKQLSGAPSQGAVYITVIRGT